MRGTLFGALHILITGQRRSNKAGGIQMRRPMNALGFMIIALGAGILFARILPAWFLVFFMGILIILFGMIILCC